jgi:transcriptional regulator with XRE-family HTH domain
MGDQWLFKQRIEDRLKEDQRSQAWLARKLGYSPAQLNKWLKGDNRIPYGEVDRIAKLLKFERSEQVELFALAGYPLPSWVSQALIDDPSAPSTLGRLAGAAQDLVCFPSTEQALHYMSGRLTHAAELVCDFAWCSGQSGHADGEHDAYAVYTSAIEALCRRQVAYREVLALHRNALFGLIRVERKLALQLPTHSLRHYHLDRKRAPELLTFVIVDQTELLLSTGVRLRSGQPTTIHHLAVRQPALVTLFQDYFDALWGGLTPIKEGETLYADLFRAIKAELLDQVW